MSNKPEHVFLPSQNAVWTSQTFLRSAVEEGLAMRDYSSWQLTGGSVLATTASKSFALQLATNGAATAAEFRIHEPLSVATVFFPGPSCGFLFVLTGTFSVLFSQR